MLQLELRRERDQRLGMTEKQIAAVDEAIVEAVDHHSLRGVVEIDDHVPAEDHVDVTEEGDARLVIEVEAAEGHAIADLVADAPRAILFAREVLVANVRIGRPKCGLAILSLTRAHEHLLADVAGKDVKGNAFEGA